jgi:hypothetical protein
MIATLGVISGALAGGAVNVEALAGATCSRQRLSRCRCRCLGLDLLLLRLFRLVLMLFETLVPVHNSMNDEIRNSQEGIVLSVSGKALLPCTAATSTV